MKAKSHSHIISATKFFDPFRPLKLKLAFNFSNSSVQYYHGGAELTYRIVIVTDVFLLLDTVD